MLELVAVMETELRRTTGLWRGGGNGEPSLLCTLPRLTRDLSVSKWQKEVSPSLWLVTNWLVPMDGTFSVGFHLRFWSGVLFSSLAMFHTANSRLLIR